MSTNPVSSQSQPTSTSPTETVETTEAVDASIDTSAETSSAEAVDEKLEELTSKDPEDLTKEDVEEIKFLNKLKLKIDQKEYEEELPFDIPDDPQVVDYLTRHLQLSKMGQTRAQQYKDLEKEVSDFIKQLKADPESILSDPSLGIDLKKLAAKVIEKDIVDSQKSPEQLEKEKLQAELKAEKEEREREKSEYEKREFARLQDQEYERYDVLISDALSKSDLPKTPYTVKKIADYMLLGLQQGLNVEPQDIIPLVKEEMHKDLKEMFGLMPDEVIEQIIGKDILTRMRKKNVAKAKEKGTPPTPVNKALVDTGKKTEQKVDGKSKQTFKDFFGV